MQETAKQCTKFVWPALSDVGAVTKPRRKPVEICWGAPNPPTDLRHLCLEVHHIVRICGGDIAV